MAQSRSLIGVCDELDFPGIAQEFLRRNPDYQRDWQETIARGPPNLDAMEVMARRWGLAFPL